MIKVEYEGRKLTGVTEAKDRLWEIGAFAISSLLSGEMAAVTKGPYDTSGLVEGCKHYGKQLKTIAQLMQEQRLEANEEELARTYAEVGNDFFALSESLGQDETRNFWLRKDGIQKIVEKIERVAGGKSGKISLKQLLSATVSK